MKLKFALAGLLIAGFVTPTWGIDAKEHFYIFHDVAAKKCTVVKEKPTVGTVGSGNTYDSEDAAKVAMEKMQECSASK